MSGKQALQIGMLGGGVVGTGVLHILNEHAKSIEARTGKPIEVRKVVVRDLNKPRPGIDRALLTDNPADVLDDPDIDLVIEVIGGVEQASGFIQRALSAGKSVVTANKALIAEQGHKLIVQAEDAGVDLYFEAAVGGGVPIIRVLREALASDRITSLKGIVNGTSNYMLTRMSSAQLDFAEALKEAQAAGYAEADPTLDVNGGDAAHKLTILATMAYGAQVKPKDVYTEGIEQLAAIDMQFAERFGYVIKPLAIASIDEQQRLDLRVHPALVKRDSVLSTISGVLNAVHIQAAALGPCLLSGHGAGALPTAVSIVSDIVDVGRNLLSGARGRVPARAFREEHLHRFEIRDIGELQARYYLRFSVLDKPGVLAQIAGILGQHSVSIEQIVQEGRAKKSEDPVTVVILTHRALEKDVRAALRQIDGLEYNVSPSRSLRVEAKS